MNTLTPAGAGQTLELAKVLSVLARRADIEGKVAVHAVMRARNLVGERLRGHRQRIGIGHLEHGGDAAQHRTARAGFEIFLVGEARLAEMHMAVDHAGQHVQAAAVDHLAADARDKSPIAAKRLPRTPMSRTPSPSWLTTVPPLRMRS